MAVTTIAPDDLLKLNDFPQANHLWTWNLNPSPPNGFQTLMVNFTLASGSRIFVKDKRKKWERLGI